MMCCSPCFGVSGLFLHEAEVKVGIHTTGSRVGLGLLRNMMAVLNSTCEWSQSVKTKAESSNLLFASRPFSQGFLFLTVTHLVASLRLAVARPSSKHS